MNDSLERYPPESACVFCRIVAGDEPATYVAPDGFETSDRSLVKPDGVMAFRNRLTWLPVMLLTVPLGHATQEQLWADESLFVPATRLAIALGRERCLESAVPAREGDRRVVDEGFRLISNFGRIAHQTQAHGHIHTISRPVYNHVPEVPSDAAPLRREGDILVHDSYVDSAPWSVRLTISGVDTQCGTWTDARFPELVRLAIETAEAESPAGYRITADFLPEPGMGSPGLFILGGGQLELYA